MYAIQILGILSIIPKQIYTITTSQIHDPHYLKRENRIMWTVAYDSKRKKSKMNFSFDERQSYSQCLCKEKNENFALPLT